MGGAGIYTICYIREAVKADLALRGRMARLCMQRHLCKTPSEMRSRARTGASSSRSKRMSTIIRRLQCRTLVNSFGEWLWTLALALTRCTCCRTGRSEALTYLRTCLRRSHLSTTSRGSRQGSHFQDKLAATEKASELIPPVLVVGGWLVVILATWVIRRSSKGGQNRQKEPQHLHQIASGRSRKSGKSRIQGVFSESSQSVAVRVTGSIPVGATNKIRPRIRGAFLFWRSGVLRTAELLICVRFDASLKRTGCRICE